MGGCPEMTEQAEKNRNGKMPFETQKFKLADECQTNTVSRLGKNLKRHLGACSDEAMLSLKRLIIGWLPGTVEVPKEIGQKLTVKD